VDKRQSNRVICNLNANIISGGKSCGGFIDNVSEDGIEYLITSAIKSSIDFVPEKMITLSFQTPAGKKLNLDCEVKWYIRTAPDDETLTLGMKILNPPATYYEFIQNIDRESIN
jgi:hypothetical protein